MTKARRARRNALTHGAFSAVAILPGEDPQDFERVYSALVDEWRPDGATEADAVLTIAKGMWRKRRIQKFVQAKILEGRFDREHPIFDRAAALRVLCGGGLINSPEQFASFMHILPEQDIDYLNKHVPRKDFDSGTTWFEAVRKIVFSVLVPDADFRAANNAPERLLLGSQKIVGEEEFKRELALDERIDAMIDRAIKRLVQIKAVKQMMHSNSPAETRTRQISKKSAES